MGSMRLGIHTPQHAATACPVSIQSCSKSITDQLVMSEDFVLASSCRFFASSLHSCVLFQFPSQSPSVAVFTTQVDAAKIRA